MINLDVLKKALKELDETELKVLFYITSLCENNHSRSFLDLDKTLVNVLAKDVLGEITVDTCLDIKGVLNKLEKHLFIKIGELTKEMIYYSSFLYEPKPRTEKEIEEKKAEMDFRFRYLDPKKYWNDSVSLSTQLNELQERANYKALEYASRMNYSDFLKTPYWKTISAKVKQMHNYTCQLCGKTGVQLHTHHPSNYCFRGFELYHLNELMCLCSDCHSKFHNKN